MNQEIFSVIMRSEVFRNLKDNRISFEPFKIMGIHKKEVIHSRILGYYLKRKSHNDEFFNLFINHCCQKELLYKNCNFSFDIANINKRQVYLEYPFERLGENYNYIDIVITYGNTVIAIENKLYAGEGKDQLKRYQGYLNSRSEQNKLIIFLTLSEKTPVTHLQEISENGVNILLLSWIELIELLKRVQPENDLEKYYTQLLINHLNLNYMIEKEIQDECLNLFRTNPLAYQKIVKNYNKCVQRNSEELFKDLKNNLIHKYDEALDFTETVDRTAKDGKGQYELDIRKKTWPEGVYIKIYRINAFGVFPYIVAQDNQKLKPYRQVEFQFKENSLYYFTTENWFNTSEEKTNLSRRFISKDGNLITQEHISEALKRFQEYYDGINQKLSE